jgi:hypothetical protein
VCCQLCKACARSHLNWLNIAKWYDTYTLRHTPWNVVFACRYLPHCPNIRSITKRVELLHRVRERITLLINPRRVRHKDCASCNPQYELCRSMQNMPHCFGSIVQICSKPYGHKLTNRARIRGRFLSGSVGKCSGFRPKREQEFSQLLASVSILSPFR